MRRMKFASISLILAASFLACGDDGDGKERSDPVPANYSFGSRFDAESSVAYSGQTGRHVLILEMKNEIGSWSDATFQGAQTGDVVEVLDFYFDFKNAGGSADDPLTLELALPVAQSTFGDVGGLVSLAEKMPEVDAGFAGGVYGWGDDSMSPSAVVADMFAELETVVLNRADGTLPLAPDGSSIPTVYVSSAGVDYRELLQKFLTGAVAYSQGSDDYLDDDAAGKGLLSDNSVAVDGHNYTALEHVWDEGFGYFGAARDYGDYTDEEIAAKGGRNDYQAMHDSDGDGTLDLGSEVILGHSANAGKRDLGAGGATDLTGDAFEAFKAGRQLITAAAGPLSESDQARLASFRDQALGAWEKAIVATAIHYVNDVLGDMESFDTADYVFLDHAKHWSELAGFALSLQFNPDHSIVDSATLQDFIDAVGEAPVLPSAGAGVRDSYAAGLESARDALGAAYGFDAATVGAW